MYVVNKVNFAKNNVYSGFRQKKLKFHLYPEKILPAIILLPNNSRGALTLRGETFTLYTFFTVYLFEFFTKNALLSGGSRNSIAGQKKRHSKYKKSRRCINQVLVFNVFGIFYITS